MRQACKQWVLAGAVVCALVGLMLMATDPVEHHSAPARACRGMAERANGSTGGQPPADVPTTPAPGTPSPQPVTSANADPPASHDVAFQSGDVQFPTAGRVAIPIDAKIQHEGSVSLWVQPGWQPGNEDDATLVQLGDRLRLKKNVDVLRLEAADAEAGNADETADVGAPISDWNPGEWHHVTATWKED